MIKFVDIKIGDDVTFYALIENMQKRFTPNKSGYYGATLSDGDSSIDARIWDCNLVESKDITAGNVYRFTAHVNEYAGKAQYVIKNIEIQVPFRKIFIVYLFSYKKLWYTDFIIL